MNCPICNAPLPAGTQICPQCGWPVNRPHSPAQEYPPSWNTPYQDGFRRNSGYAAWYRICAWILTAWQILTVIVVIGTLIYFIVDDFGLFGSEYYRLPVYMIIFSILMAAAALVKIPGLIMLALDKGSVKIAAVLIGIGLVLQIFALVVQLIHIRMTGSGLQIIMNMFSLFGIPLPGAVDIAMIAAALTGAARKEITNRF